MGNRTVDRRAVLLAVAVAVLAAPAVAFGGGDPAVTRVSYDGDGAIESDRNSRLVWASADHAFTVAVEGLADDRSHEVCLRVDAAGGRPLACRTTEPGATSPTLAFERVDWPANLTGRLTVEAVVRPANGSAVLASGDLPLYVLHRDGDVDGDGLANDEEVEVGTNVTVPDTDGDGLDDGTETEAGTDPTVADTDGDGLNDGREREAGTNPNRADTDGDGLDDREELQVYETDPTEADTDGDGLDDRAEVHEYKTDPTTADSDGDGLSDGAEVNVHGTDPNTVDTDADGLSDRAEVETYHTDPTTADTDGDGLDDGPEVNNYGTDPNNPDTDGDGLDDGTEIEHGTDPTQVNTEVESGLPSLAGRVVEDLPAALLLGGVAVGAVGVAVLLYRRRRRPGVARFERTEEPAPEEDHTPEQGRDGSTAEEPAAERASPTPTMTDEERVLALLDREGGRIPQTAIVEETGWSKAKVSKLLSRMADADEVRKVSLGRENLIARPGSEPDIARSEREDREG